MRHHRFGAGALGIAAAGLLGVLGATPALAHTTKNAGPFMLTFGWQHEPTYVGVQNGVQLFVHDAANVPVDDLGAKGLTVQVTTQGHISPPLPLQATYDKDTGLGNHGEFDAAILPTLAGAYTFHIQGDINGTPVDVSASSSESTFNSAGDPTSIEFPSKTPTVQALGAAVTNLQANLAAAQSAAATAQRSARSATTLAIGAIAAAAFGLIAVVVRGRRKAPTPA